MSGGGARCYFVAEKYFSLSEEIGNTLSSRFARDDLEKVFGFDLADLETYDPTDEYEFSEILD